MNFINRLRSNFVILPIWLLFFSMLTQLSYGQDTSDFFSQDISKPMASWEIGYKFGRIVKHTGIFEPTITENSTLYAATYLQPTVGKALWKQLYNHPILGISLVHARFGDAQIFGEAYGLLPLIEWKKSKRKVTIHKRIGLGISYLNTPYHAITNPTNNVIGAKINNITMFMFGISKRIRQQWDIMGSLSLTHFSNGRTSVPNLGINLLALGINVRYNGEKNCLLQYKEAYHPTVAEVVKRPWRLNVNVLAGTTESKIANGPNFPIYSLAAYWSKRVDLKKQLLIGFEGVYYGDVYTYIINNVTYTEKERMRAMKAYPFIGYEYFINHVSVSAHLGYYVYNPFFSRGRLPLKLGLQYYLHSPYKPAKHQFWVGLYMKTHLGNADYLGLGVGYAF